MNVRFGPAFDEAAYFQRKTMDKQNRSKSQKLNHIEHSPSRPSDNKASHQKPAPSVLNGLVIEQELPSVEQILQNNTNVRDLTGEDEPFTEQAALLIATIVPVEDTTEAQREFVFEELLQRNIALRMSRIRC